MTLLNMEVAESWALCLTLLICKFYAKILKFVCRNVECLMDRARIL